MRNPTRFFERTVSSRVTKAVARKDSKDDAESHKETKDFIIFKDDSEEEVKVVDAKNTVHEKLNIEGLPLRFPFKPYPCQIQLMSKVLRALKAKEHGLLESPTGTGKTMSLLCSALAWLEALKSSYALKSTNKQVSPDELVIHEKPDSCCEAKSCKDGNEKEELDVNSIPKIYFASRTHKQLSQVVKELRRSTYNPKFCVLASRSHYCINHRVRQARDINEACVEAITSEKNHCRYISKVEKFVQKDGDSVLSKNMEELVDFGNDNDLCPYYLSREIVDKAEIIFCPFDYIVNQTIREAMNIRLEGSVVIFDEAHNIEDVCRDAGGVELTGGQLIAILNELNQLFDPLSGAPLERLELPSAHMSQLSLVTVLHNWLFNSMWKSTTQKDYEKDVDIWAGEEIMKTLKAINITRDTVIMWQTQLLQIDEHRKKIKERLSEEYGENDKDKPLIMSQGSQRLLSSLYCTLLFSFGQNYGNLSSYRLVRQREYKIGTLLL